MAMPHETTRNPLGSVLSVADAQLESRELDPAQIVSGDPRVSELVLSKSPDGRVLRTIWQMTPGVITDTEYDEMFVVISGRATVEFSDETIVQYGPGDVGFLTEGARTTWTVHETIRKVCQATLSV